MSEEPKVEPLSAEELAELAIVHASRERLIEVNDNDGQGWKPLLARVCDDGCDDLWPCETARWLATIDAERARADAAVELLRWVVDHRGLIWPAERVVEIEAVIGQSPTNHNLCPPRICPRRKTPIDKKPSRG